MANLIENGDFSETQNGCPLDWGSFGWATVKMADDKYEGKNSCRTFDREHDYSAISQDVSYAINLGEITLCNVHTAI